MPGQNPLIHQVVGNAPGANSSLISKDYPPFAIAHTHFTSV
jgi:hypothetical protein